MTEMNNLIRWCTTSHVLFANLMLMACATVNAAERPNILIVFTDDQGFADIGCYGSPTNKTPRLDQLAAEGTRFTSFYSKLFVDPLVRRC